MTASRRAAPAISRRALLASALPLGGCAAPMTSALRARPPAGMPARAELDATPFFPQTEYQCGPAALATALVAAGIETDPQRLTSQVFVPAREGSLQIEMLAGARRAGALAVKLPGTLDAVLREVAAGTPAVVLLNLGLAIAPRWHYAVLIGYDLDARDAVLRSGTTRRDVMPLSTFEHTWARSAHWAFVALPAPRLPVTATEADVSEALLGFERVAKPDAAARAYQAALERWPQNLTFGMGHGNTLYAAGRADAAAAAFERSARLHDSAAAWSNLARVQLSLGRRDAARSAALRAVERAQSSEPQWLDAAKATLTEVIR